MKNKLIVSIFVLGACVAIISIVSNLTKYKEYNNVNVDDNIDTISDCIECARTILNMQSKDIYLSDFIIVYDEPQSKKAKSVDMSFVKKNNFPFFQPYTWYSITLDIEKGIAKNIKKRNCEYIVYDNLDFCQCKFDLNNALNNKEIEELFDHYQILQNSQVKIITYNDFWEYRFINNRNEKVEIRVNSK